MRLPKSRSRKKAIGSIDSNFKKGLLLLQDKLYKQAMIELKIALEHNPMAVKPELEKLFEKYEENENKEIALTIGLVLLQVKKDEQLAIKLGNFSRQLGNYKQANNLYRQALKINRNSINAFYNLAASMGQIDWYDDDIPKLIDQFFNVKSFVYPEYIDENETIVAIIDDITISNREAKQKEIAYLNQELEKARSESDSEKEEDIKRYLETVIDRSEQATYQQITSRIKKYVQQQIDKKINEKERAQLNKDIYNLGLYALKNQDAETALEHFLILKSNEVEIGELQLCLALASALNGLKEEAIRMLNDCIRTDRENRLLNINLALLHRRAGNKLLTYKYQIISASLLEKSKGLVYTQQIAEKADLFFRQGRLDNALKLYQIVAYESNDVRAWLQIAEIHLLQKRQLEAMDALKEIQRFAPDSQLVENKLEEVHELIKQQADNLFNSSKFSQAAVLYERSLKLIRQPETVEKLISTYKRLNKHKMVQSLYEEIQELKMAKREEARLEKRRAYIETGKEYLRNQEFDSAILAFENAFNIFPDKDVFAYLAHIYKGLKRKRMLKDLVERWNEFETKRAAAIKQKEASEKEDNS